NYNAITIEEKKTTPAASEGKSASQPDQPYHQAGDIIIGTWKQYGYFPQSGQWEYLATFEVAKVHGSYTVISREQRESAAILNSIGIFDVQSDGTSWTF